MKKPNAPTPQKPWFPTQGVTIIGVVAGLYLGTSHVGSMMLEGCPDDPTQVAAEIAQSDPEMADHMAAFCIANRELSVWNPRRFVTNGNLFWLFAKRKFDLG